MAAGALFGIDPLDQPGVEEGKQFAYGIMGRAGYEAKRKEVESLPGGTRGCCSAPEKVLDPTRRTLLPLP